LATDEEGDDVILAIDVVPAVVGAAEDTEATLFTGATAEASNASFPTGAAVLFFLAVDFLVEAELVVAALVAEEALYEGSRSHL
jgi:hypothetical protein